MHTLRLSLSDTAKILGTNEFCALLLVLVGYFFAFPNALSVHSALFHCPFAVLAVPAGLFYAAYTAASAKNAFLRTWLFGGLGSSSAIYWVAVPVHDFGGLPWFAAVACPLALGAWLGLFTGLFGLGVYGAKRLSGADNAVHCNSADDVKNTSHANDTASRDNTVSTNHTGNPNSEQSLLSYLCLALFSATWWVLLEWLRSVGMFGSSWLSLASAFVPLPLFTQGAWLMGATALSGVWALCGGLFALAVCSQAQKRTTGILGATALGIILCLALFGAWRLNEADKELQALQSDLNTASLSVSLVQGNINQNQKWSQHYLSLTLERYLSLSDHAIKTRAPSLIIFPETSMPFDYNAHSFAVILRNFCRTRNIALLFGVAARDVNTNPFAAKKTYNRAQLILPNGSDTNFYNKEHLVPFGEFLPPFLHFAFMEQFMEGIGEFTAGTPHSAPLPVGTLTKAVSSIKSAPPNSDNSVSMGMLICYEASLPHLAQERVEQGASLLGVISNDAWFGKTAAPYQHLHISTLRAVEQGRFMARATNTGVSAFITPQGRIVNASKLFRPAVVRGTMYSVQKTTPYHSIYRSVLPVCALLGVFALVLLLWQKRRHTQR